MISGKTTTKDDSDCPSNGDLSFFKEIQVEFLIHELKDPLSVIETGIRTLLEKQGKYGILSDRQVRTLSRVLRNSARARQMVHDLLEVGRAQAACMDRCWFSPAKSLFAAVADALETRPEPGERAPLPDCGPHELRRWLEACHVDLAISPQAENMDVCLDEVKFRSIVGNLVKNALQYRRQRMTVAMAVQDDRVVVTVDDDGPGIEPRYHEAIFQRYRRLESDMDTLRKGHGLGLACSRILARSMGGEIELTSRRGNGASFRLFLPVSTIVPGGDTP